MSLRSYGSKSINGSHPVLGESFNAEIGTKRAREEREWARNKYGETWFAKHGESKHDPETAKARRKEARHALDARDSAGPASPNTDSHSIVFGKFIYDDESVGFTTLNEVVQNPRYVDWRVIHNSGWQLITGTDNEVTEEYETLLSALQAHLPGSHHDDSWTNATWTTSNHLYISKSDWDQVNEKDQNMIKKTWKLFIAEN